MCVSKKSSLSYLLQGALRDGPLAHDARRPESSKSRESDKGHTR